MDRVRLRLQGGGSAGVAVSARDCRVTRGAGTWTSNADSNDVIDNGVAMDENEEWAKIENIMASLDAGLSHCDVSNGLTTGCSRGDATTTECREMSVGQWLTTCRLSHLEDLLLANGFDDINFIGPSFMSDSDLIEIGVVVAEDRRRLLLAASHLPSATVHTPKQFENLRSWLRSLRLLEYVDTFQTHGFTTLERLHNLWDVELTSVLRVGRLGHRNRLLTAVGMLPPSTPLATRGQLDEDNWCSKSAKQSLNELSLYKDYTTLLHSRSKTSQSLTAGSLQRRQQWLKQQQQMDTATMCTTQQPERLQIRPPQTSDSDIKQWTHKPEVLLHGGCKYQALYIGSGVVEPLNDPDATRLAIASIRKESASIHCGGTQVSVTLTISHTGVQFCHFKTQEVMGSHDIGSIFCACQDGTQLNYFAYVTWQPSLGQHHCHVFCADTVQLAIEVVLTLGQAFEVAYQLVALRNGTATENRPAATNSVQNGGAFSEAARSPIVANNHATIPLRHH